MSEVKFKGIVLRSVDYKEKDKLLTIFTLEFGKVTAILRGVRGFRAKLKFAKEIFCFADFVVAKKNGFNVITSAEGIETFHSLSNNIDGYFEACSIVDIVNIITKNDESDAALFIEVLKCLKAIKENNIKPYYVLIKFLLNIFFAAGYKISIERCLECNEKFLEGDGAYLDLDTGEMVCKSCKGENSVFVSQVSLKTLQLINETEYERLHTLNLYPGSEVSAFKMLQANFSERFSVSFKNFLNI